MLDTISIDGVCELFDIKYNAAAASMFLIWDYCITLGVEVEYILRYRGSWITLLFFTIRYLALANVIVVSALLANAAGDRHVSCDASAWIPIITTLILSVCVEALLIARVFAIYGGKKLVLILLIILSFCSNFARFCSIAFFAAGDRVRHDNLPSRLEYIECIAKNLPSPDFTSSFILPQFIPHTVLFLLVFIKLARENFVLRLRTSNLLLVVARDGIWAFGILFAIALWAVLCLTTTNNTGLIPFFWMTTLLSFCGTRLILNLRVAAHEPIEISG